MNLSNFQQPFPKVGDQLSSFIKTFGQPISPMQGTINRFELGTGSGYLQVADVDGEVTTVTKSFPQALHSPKAFADLFLPNNAQFIKSYHVKAEEPHFGSEPVTVYKYKHHDGRDIKIFVTELSREWDVTIALDIPSEIEQ